MTFEDSLVSTVLAKRNPHTYRYILSIALLLISAVPIAAQDDWHTYPFRDLAGFVTGEKKLYESTGKADMVISANPFPSKTRVVYTGKRRPVTEHGKRFMLLWTETRNVPASNVDLLLEEFLFLERGKEFWMPVHKRIVAGLTANAKVGEEVIIYYFYLGGFDPVALERKAKAGGKTENGPVGEIQWLFAVEQVQKAGSTFVLRKFEEVLDRAMEAPGKIDSIWNDPRQVKFKAAAAFTGKVRQASGRRKELRDLWFETNGAPGAALLMENEALFKDGENEHWILMRNQTLEHLQSFVKNGDTVYLNVILAGAVRNSKRIEWVFMAGEYSTF